MSDSYSYPGIYIQEVQGSSHAIIPAPTSIAAFVGYSHPFKTQNFNTAQQIFSFNDYITYFGPLFSSGLVDASLPRAVYQFFLNGGSNAYVMGLQPGLFDENGDIITRLGAANGGATISGTTSGGTSGAEPVVLFSANATPSLSALSIGSIPPPAAAFPLTLAGADFHSGATVSLAGPVPQAGLVPTSITPNTIVVSVPSGLTAGTYAVTVKNSGTGAASNPLNLTVTAGQLVPIVTSVSLAALTGGGQVAVALPAPGAVTDASPTIPVTALPLGNNPGKYNVTLIINGSHFDPSVTVQWLGSAVTKPNTAFISDTQIAVNVAVPANASPPTLPPTLTVTNGAGVSADFPLQFPLAGPTPPTPQITLVSPGKITAGGGAFTLIVTGNNFVQNATLIWSNSAVPGSTTITPANVTPNQFSAQISSALIATAGTVSLTVQNSATVGSNTVTFTIGGSDLTPTIASLSPAALEADAAAGETVTVTGSNFVPGMTANWSLATPGAPAPTPPTINYISDTQLQLVFGSKLPDAGVAYLSLANATGPGLVFTALELTDVVPMTVTITNVRPGGATFDVVITYASRVETFRGLSIGSATGTPLDKVINGVSQLVTVAPAAGGYGTTITAQQFELVYDFPASLSTGFSAADFTEGQAPALGPFEANGPLDNLEIFNLLLIPGVGDFSISAAALAFAERKRAFLILDAPQQAPAFGGSTATPQPVQYWMAGLNGDAGAALPRSQNGAVYYPYLISNDPVTTRNIPMAPSGFVAGIYAQTDASRGVWKAPAGLAAIVSDTAGPVLSGIMNDPQQGVLNLDSVNCLRSFAGSTVVWGARTLVAQNPAFQQWMYVPVRRMTLFIEQTLLANLRWVVFEPNDEPLWIAITQTINSFMLSLFRQGALQGDTPSQAFQVKCDSTTTSAADQATGIVNIVVAFAPLKPAEFVVIQIAQLAGQTAGS